MHMEKSFTLMYRVKARCKWNIFIYYAIHNSVSCILLLLSQTYTFCLLKHNGVYVIDRRLCLLLLLFDFRSDDFLSTYMFLQAVAETAGDHLWQNEKFLRWIITQILIDSGEYGRDAMAISVVGETIVGNSKLSDYCCMALKLISK